jgi:hypothetical protein
MTGLALVALLAGCAVAPEGTSLDRIQKTLHHQDHPDYVARPNAPTFTGAEPMMVLSDGAKAAWKADADACIKEAEATPRNPALSVSEDVRQFRERLWDCLWAKGWRWERD